MRDTITENTFVQEMAKEKHGFSYEGAQALFNYLEDYYGTEIEFDPIAFRCEFIEYENLKDLKSDYIHINSLDDLYGITQVIEIPNSEKIIVHQF